MKKITLLLILVCTSTMSVFASTNNAEEKFDLTSKIKTGDWFRIEFATQLEDYSRPVDSIDYCKLTDLKKLALKCEVTETSLGKIDLKFSFERIFRLKSTGEYADSYFSTGPLRNQSDFSISAKINTEKDTIDYLLPELPEDFYPYTLFKRKVDFDNSSITSTEYADYLYFKEVEYLIDAFLKDWQKQNYQLPLLSFDDIDATDFKKYRILDSNLPIKSNIKLEVNFADTQENDTIEITTMNNFYSYFEFVEKHLLSKKVESGTCQVDFYLEQQKLLAINYKGEKIKFLATPGLLDSSKCCSLAWKTQ